MEDPPPEETKKKEEPKPVLQESSYPNLIDLETEIRPPLYAPPPLKFPPRGGTPPGESRGLGGPAGIDHEEGPALGTWRRIRGDRGDRGGQDPGDPELPSSTVQALPVRVGPANPGGE